MLICDQGGGIGAAGGYEPPLEVVAMDGRDGGGILLSRSTAAVEKGACQFGTVIVSTPSTLFLVLVMLGRGIFFSLSTASGSCPWRYNTDSRMEKVYEKLQRGRVSAQACAYFRSRCGFRILTWQLRTSRIRFEGKCTARRARRLSAHPRLQNRWCHSRWLVGGPDRCRRLRDSP